MNAQTFMNSRRKFLERSAMGAGGLLFSSMLLASCTDHDIPDPDGPVIDPPLLGDGPTDSLNNNAKLAITTSLQLVPDVGGFISAMVDIFWPSSGDNPWDQIKAQTEALIDQKIDSLSYSSVSDDLDGLKNVTAIYLNEIKKKGDIHTNWTNLRDDFALYQPNFQQQGFELLLLPIFAQYVNMYLSTLRDAVKFGTGWGMVDVDVQQAASDLTQKISEFTQYATTTYTGYLATLTKNTATNYETNEPFKTTNAFTRQITIGVLDYMDAWPYYDATKYPNGAVNPDGTTIDLFTREIYSDPFGNTYMSSGDPRPIVLPSQATKRPTNVTVWGGDRIDAVQLTYPTGGGPGGVTQTARMGDQDGRASNQPPHGGTFSLDPDWNPLIEASVTYDWYTQDSGEKQMGINTMFFIYSNDIRTNQMGKDVGQYDSGVLFYPGRALSSIYIQGAIFTSNNTANCLIFGFLPWQMPSETLGAIGRIYITSPNERSVADFTKAFPKLGIGANLITDELRVARKKHWERIEALAGK